MQNLELYRAANANLVALRSGQARRNEEARRAAAKARKALEQEAAVYEKRAAKERKAEEAKLRERLDEIEDIWESVEVDFPDDMKRGAFEELDAERDRICERLYVLGQRY